MNRILKSTSESNIKNFYMTPILLATLMYNPKLFNGALNDQYIQLQQQQRNYQQPTQPIIPQHQYQTHATSSQPVATSMQSLQSTSFYNNNNNDSRQQQPNTHQERQLNDNKSSIACSSVQASNSNQQLKPKIEPKKVEHVTTSKFYSSKAETVIKPVQNDQPKQPNISPSDSKSKKKIDRPAGATKNQLCTWQANLTSQLLLPSDFTPELISQLTAEGYDVVSGANRKARSRQQSTLVNSINSIVDSSDEDDKEDDVFSHKSKPKEDKIISSKPKSEIRNKIDLQDANDNQSLKRFSQLLDDLIESYEQDLQQISRNKIKNSDDDLDAEIPPEYLLARQLCSDLVQEAFKLNSYSIMNLIRKENLSKLQNLIFFNIKDGLRSFNFNEVSRLNQFNKK